MQTIGFIGVGVMGRSMVKNLLKAGYEVAIYSRTKSKLTDFLAETGVQWCDTAADCAAGRDIVITMVGYPQDVEQVYFGENGIIDAARPGAYLIDMTTTDPRLSVRITEAGQGARPACAGCAGFGRRHGREKRYAVHHGRRRAGGLRGLSAGVAGHGHTDRL